MTEAVPLIYNPASGGGRGRVRFKHTASLLAMANIEVEPVPTDHPGHATVLAHDLAKEGHKRIFVLGGDGTLSEAANGVLSSGRSPAMGFLPAGTGNDFLRHFGVQDRREAMHRIRNGTTHAIDATRLTWEEDGEDHHHWAINLAGTGFAADVVDATNHRYKWARGQAYNLGVLDRLLRLRPTQTHLTLDGDTQTGHYPMVLACNTVYTGGAMMMAPMAKQDDGRLDVMWVDPIGRLELVKLLGGIRKGKHVDHPKVHFRTARRIRIEPDDASPILADGEVVGKTPVDMEQVPGALKVLL